MKRVSTISNIDCVMPQVNSRWRCSNRCEAAKSWVEYPDHIFVDRIDIQVEVTPVPFEELSRAPLGESSMQIRERVMAARARQAQRFKGNGKVHCNAQMSSRMLREYAGVDADAARRLQDAMERYDLSARAYDRILKVARTIADLDGADKIMVCHVSEAISYRK